MFKIALIITTSVFLCIAGAAGLFAMKPLDEAHADQRTSNKALPTISPKIYQALPKEVKSQIVSHAAFAQCLDNELPANLALVCEDWFKIIQDQMQVDQLCFKAWYGAIGQEDIYKTFVEGVLLYRPILNSDEGMITLKISELIDTSSEGTSRKLLKKNPIEGTFDLSKCGDARKYLVISTGYRKGINPENKDKTEIWTAPHFMIKKKIASAIHFERIMGSWDENIAPLGIFFWPGDSNQDFYDCTSKDVNSISKINLHLIGGPRSGLWASMRERSRFMFNFELNKDY